MATVLPASYTFKPSAVTLPHSQRSHPRRPHQPFVFGPRRGSRAVAAGYKVTIEHEGKSTTLDVEEDETILSRALGEGVEVPHDCKLGVCMTCPARLVSGSVDQSEGMLSDDVVERGYTLLCVSYPKSDCTIKTIPEEELLSLQLATAND